MTNEIWQVIDEKLLFSDDRQLQIFEQTVGLPDGRHVSPYYRINTKPSCAVVVTTTNGDYVMISQYKHGAGRVCLTFPGGRLELGESYIEAGMRELMEETGFVAEDWRLLGVFPIHANQHVGFVGLLCATNAQQVAEPESGDLETMNIVHVSKQEAVRAVEDGRIGLLGDVAALSLTAFLADTGVKKKRKTRFK